MGTFVIRMNNIGSGGTPIADLSNLPIDFIGWAILNYPTVGIIDCVNNEDPLTFPDITMFSAQNIDGFFSKTLRLFPSGLSIYLDGNPTPIGINDLPVGFTPLSASVELDPGTYVVGMDYFLQQGPLVEGSVDTYTFPYDFSIPPTILSIFNGGCGLKVNAIIEDGGIGSIANLRIEGTYELQSFSFTLNPQPVSISSGQQVIVTSVGPDAGLDLSNLVIDNGDGTSGINLNYTNGFGPVILNIPTINIITYTSTLLIFIIPDAPLCPTDLVYNDDLLAIRPDLADCFPTDADIELTVQGNGIQFSGTLSLGILSVLIEDASGIYQIIKNKTNDTFYTRKGYISVITRLLFAELLNDPIIEPIVIDLNLYPYRLLDEEIIDENEDNFIIMTGLEHRVSQEVFAIDNVFARTGYVGG